MSADNWGNCPRCYARAKDDYDALLVRAGESYGKVSVEEFDAIRAEAAKPLQRNSTLREDYELYITDEGEINIVYSCACGTCDFNYQYTFKKQLVVSA